ncbi:MAG: hypothetical protein D6803_02805 [Anaerolineae bacterium]|nr:MAG: hypothetical protein D6803_02805 [Anaerolineae bacterium]
MTTTTMTLVSPRLRQALYRLFAWLFLYPDDERLELLRRGAAELLENTPLWEGMAYAGGLQNVLATLAAMTPEQAEALRKEHMRLFVVKPLAPPYESFYVAPDAEARGWVTVQMQRLYARHGLKMGELNELPDHLAVELEFLSWLFEQEADAQERSNMEQAGAMQEECENFLNRHLRRWLPALAEKVRQGAPDGVYVPVMGALLDFISQA